MMNEPQCCPSCGISLPGRRLDGFCPACAWKELSNHDAADEVPKQVGRESGLLMRVPGYELLEEIARGGMGIVYRAQQLEPRRTVALKMLLPHQLGSAEMAERFRLEVRALTELDQPAILPVYQVGEHNGLPFFTMKLATGGTLAQRKHQLFGNWRAIAELVVRLAEAVQFAHEHGVLHRDLKPGNILFDEQDRAYVSDFGLAKLVSEDTDLTRSASFLGTPHYVSPEVAARSARQATTASDVYSLGAILYELLSGHLPFEADGVPALLKKIVESEPARVNCGQPGARPGTPVPRDLEVICLKCLAKEPPRRYGSARELAEDLRRWLEGKPIQARPVAPAERLWRWAVRNPALAAVSASLALTLLLGAPLLWRANHRLREALEKSARAEAAALANLQAQLLAQVRSQRPTGYGGNPAAALELVERAARIKPTLEARNEAVAALAAGGARRPVFRELDAGSTGQAALSTGCTFDISHDDRLLLVGTMAGVQLRDTASGRQLWSTNVPALPWMYVAFHPDGRSLLYSTRETGIVRCEYRWRDGAGGEVVAEVGEPQTIGRPYDSTIQSIGPGGWVVALDRDPLFIVRMDLWPDGDPQRARTIASGERMTALSLSPDGRWAASTTLPVTDVRLWDALTGRSTGLLGVTGAGARQFSPDNRWLVVRGPKEFRLWEVGSWKPGPAWAVPPGARSPARICFSPDGRTLALPQTITQFQLVDMGTYAELVSLSSPAQVHDATWSHDGKHLYLLANDNRVLDWNIGALGQELAKLKLNW
jgi:WD40 repeat protein